MCEMVAAAWPEPHGYAVVHEWARSLESYGLGGFGWGVAWLADDGKVRVERGLGRYADEADLADVTSSRFLVHLRRPNKLSTVQYADTQPFARDGDFAFCHNGFLDRADELRPRYADRLAGRADSEVGWAFFQDRLDEGVAPAAALREVDETFHGKVNLGYLDRTGRLALHAGNLTNAMWRFAADGAEVVSTALHSDDESVFDLVYPGAEQRAKLAYGSGAVLGGS